MKKVRNPVTFTTIVVEDGLFSDGSKVGLKRLKCDSHGDTYIFDNLVVKTLAERLELSRKPWAWCEGCAVMYGEILHYPSNWFGVSAK